MTTSPAEPTESTLAAVLADAVRRGLWGANVPAGMDVPVAIHTADPKVVAAQNEFVRRALVWALHPHGGNGLAILAATPTAARIAQLEADLAAAEAKLAAVEAAVLRLSGRYARLCTLHQGDWDDSADDEVEADVLSAVLVVLRAALATQPAP